MLQKGFNYYTPLQKFSDTQFDSKVWKKMFQLYEKKKYKDSFLELLKFADKKILKKYKTGPNSFRVPHGSIFVNIDISETEISIRADFIGLPEENRIPLYRKISELNFSGLNLAQVKREGDLLYIEYKTSLATYHPYKVYDSLSDICFFADQYDDEFIEKFGAKEITQGDITPVKDAQKKQAWKDLQSILTYSLAVIDELEKQRKNDLVWDTLSTTYKLIDASFSPQGTTMLELSRQVGKLYDRKESFTNILYNGKEYLKSLQKIDEDKFTKDLYGVSVFIPHKKVMNNEEVAQYIGRGYADAFNLFRSGDYSSAYLMLIHVLYNAMYYNMMSKGMEKTIRKVLKKHANTKVDKAGVQSMFQSVASIVNLDNIESNSSGIWSILIAIIFFILGAVFNG